MNKELETTVLKAVDYTNSETEKYTRRVFWILMTGAVLWICSQIICHTSLVENNVMSAISDFAMGLSCGMVISGIVITSRFGKRIREFKQRLVKMK